MSAGPGPLVDRIVTGGQTGVDRGTLDAARARGLACGGWCPAGRAAEDGPIPARYPLRETPSPDPAQRTAWNVRDSDATLVLARGEPRGGTALAVREARRLGRPLHVVPLGAGDEAEAEARMAVRAWLRRHRVRVLHVAGPRESEEPGVGAQARRFLAALLEEDDAPASPQPPGRGHPASQGGRSPQAGRSRARSGATPSEGLA